MKEIETKAINIVNQLKEVQGRHERTFPADIDVVLVLSGPGTYYDRLKPDQEEWMRWMDRDRIRAGVAVVREVTATRISESTAKPVKGHHVSKEGILDFGPFFVYNGIPVENEVLRKAIGSQFCKLPKEKVVIIDEVAEDDGTCHPIRHTADQVKSFYQELANSQSILFGIKNVALVAHIPDFVRIPFYTKKYDDKFGGKLNFWIYALKSRPQTEGPHSDWELPRLVRYAEQGHLATEPSPFST